MIAKKGKDDENEEVTLSVGMDMESKADVLFEDRESGVKVVFNDSDPYFSREEIEGVLRQDPNYSFIFDGEITKERTVELFRQKADLITNNWDKPASVFSSMEIEGHDRKQIE